MIAIPARYRKIIYVVSAVVALLLGCLQAFFSGSHLAQPPWVLGVVTVLAFLQSVISGMAAARTPKADPPAAQAVSGQGTGSAR